MPAPVVNSDLIQISAMLRDLPFNPVITCDSKSVALNQLRGVSLVNHVETAQ